MSDLLKQKVRQLYQFLREANQLRFRPVRQLVDQPKVVSLSDLPPHPSIQLVRPASVDNGNYIPDTILTVNRPVISKCPTPPDILHGWLEPRWDDPHKLATVLQSQNEIDENEETITVLFEDDEARVTSFKEWSGTRDKWCGPEILARKALRYFEIFYEIHSYLEKDSEQLELLVADGFLSWRTASGIDGPVTVAHPILLKRVELRFDPNVPAFTVHETDRESELYSSLFVDLKNVAPAALRSRQTDLAAVGYHPLGWEDTDAFLKAFILTISPLNGEYLDSPGGTAIDSPRLWRAPVLLLRKRTTGIANAIDAIIDDIDQRVVFPPALSLITGAEGEWSTAGIGGEGSGGSTSSQDSRSSYLHDDEILLAKEANEEQLQIIKRLSHSGAVLVQGPPGTGKTHTIGNLMGHLLSEGKSILVTSHTTKALRVLRDKVPEMLQPLCVSVLGSDQDSRRQLESSVSSITERLTKDNSSSLLARARKYREERSELQKKCRKLEATLREALENEYREIGVGPKEYSPSDAGRYVFEHAEKHGWIPSPVKLGADLVLTAQDFMRLYGLGPLFTAEEERDAKLPLPELSSLPTAQQFQVMVTEYQDLLTRDLSHGQELWSKCTGTSEEIGELFGALATEFSADLRRLNWRPYAIIAGIHGGTDRQVWDSMMAMIEGACEANAQHALVMHNRPKLSQSITVHRQRQLCTDICNYLETGGKLGFLQLVTKSEWREFLKTTAVAAGTPAHREHFIAIGHLAHLESTRFELEGLWDRMVGQITGTPFKSLGLSPELACRSLVPEIRRCLDWFTKVWSPIAVKLKEVGLKIDEVLASMPRDADQITEYLVIERAAVELLPPALEVEAARRKLRECEEGFSRLADLSAKIDPRNPDSGCVGRITTAVRMHSSAAYQEALEYTRRLHSVKSLAIERDTMLNRLRDIAPGWAEQISMRQHPHDRNVPPGEIAPSWTWRQLHDILAERDKLEAEKLQREIDKARVVIRQLTLWLIDAQAWGRQLERLQGNNHVRQALVGWLDTTNRLNSTRKLDRRQALLSESRKLMKQCAEAVPVWIMPISVMAESFDPRTMRFDVVIIDEASQADLTALIPLYMGKQIVIVGDHEQVTPLGVGKDQTILDNLRKSILQDIPNSHLFDNLSSIYDIGRQSFGDAIRLVEHFRCVPEIIAFSNQLCYNGAIKPLRESNSTSLKPACVPYRVEGYRINEVNKGEAEKIVSLIQSMIKHPAYEGKTIGVISMIGESQAVLIETMLHKQIDGVELQKRRIQSGISGQFQGDERDVIFLSMVDSPETEGYLRAVGDGAFEQTKKRYNVATSRARDQLWIVHSFDPDKNLKPNDIRYRLMQHMNDPLATLRAFDSQVNRTESEFERKVLKRLTDAGYRVKTQWQVGYYRIDMVVEGSGKRLAIECDGDRFHPPEKVSEDLLRQTVLERLGWIFSRIRGSAFYRNPYAAMAPIFEKLEEIGIFPGSCEWDNPITNWDLVRGLESMWKVHADEEEAPVFAEEEMEGSVTNEVFCQQFELVPDPVVGDSQDVLHLIKKLGGRVPFEILLQHLAKSRGYQRLGRKIRSELEYELSLLEKHGVLVLEAGVVSLPR